MKLFSFLATLSQYVAQAAKNWNPLEIEGRASERRRRRLMMEGKEIKLRRKKYEIILFTCVASEYGVLVPEFISWDPNLGVRWFSISISLFLFTSRYS